MQGQEEAGITRIHEGMVTCRGLGTEMARSHFLALLSEAYGNVGQSEEGLRVLSEALEFVEKTGERIYEAELYRLKGKLTLQKAGTRGWGLETGPSSSQAPSLKPQVPSGAAQEAEECFLKAIEIAQKQQAKSLELRATMSLARLWRQQGKQHTARNTLSAIYNWFTEGFDTKDLQEAKALIEELSH
jgi:predicted ATPase